MVKPIFEGYAVCYIVIIMILAREITIFAFVHQFEGDIHPNFHSEITMFYHYSCRNHHFPLTAVHSLIMIYNLSYRSFFTPFKTASWAITDQLYGFLMVFLWFSWWSHHFPMVFPGFSWGFRPSPSERQGFVGAESRAVAQGWAAQIEAWWRHQTKTSGPKENII